MSDKEVKELLKTANDDLQRTLKRLSNLLKDDDYDIDEKVNFVEVLYFSIIRQKSKIQTLKLILDTTS